jgi:hypothetical protein
MRRYRKLPPTVDPQILELCLLLNMLPGIETFESCCGHGHGPVQIYFRVHDQPRAEGLGILARHTCPRCTGVENPMKILIDHADYDLVGSGGVFFYLLQGEVGQLGYDEVNRLSEALRKHLEGVGLPKAH